MGLTQVKAAVSRCGSEPADRVSSNGDDCCTVCCCNGWFCNGWLEYIKRSKEILTEILSCCVACEAGLDFDLDFGFDFDTVSERMITMIKFTLGSLSPLSFLVFGLDFCGYERDIDYNSTWKMTLPWPQALYPSSASTLTLLSGSDDKG